MRGNDVKKLSSFIKHRYADNYIVCKDLHRYPRDSILSIFNRTMNNIPEYDRDNIHLVIVSHALEAWYLADINAINSVFGVNIRREIQNPEGIEDPADYLDDLLKKHGKRYRKNPTKAKEMMAQADLPLIRSKCPTFNELMTILENN